MRFAAFLILQEFVAASQTCRGEYVAILAMTCVHACLNEVWKKQTCAKVETTLLEKEEPSARPDADVESIPIE